MKKVLISLTLLFLILLSKQVDGRVIHVPSDSSTIQKGINGAEAGDTILVAVGIYSTATNGEIFPIYMKSGVILLSEAGAEDTWILANYDTTVIKCLNVGSTTIIKGFKISKGQSTKGGGIYCENSSIQIIDNKISYNNGIYGAGIYCQGGSPEIRNSEVTNNNTFSANGYGAGIYCSGSAAKIIGNIIDTNTIGIWGNYTEGYGGGIFCENSSSLIIDNIIQKNVIYGTQGGLWSGSAYGAGIYCFNCPFLKISGNTIKNNTSSIPYASRAYGAGMYYAYCTQPKISRNLIIGNIATSPTGGSWSSGGIYFDNSFSDSVYNNTIDSNTAGGIVCSFSELRIYNNIISNSPSGGGIKCGSSSTLEISYNDVWNNSGGNFLNCPSIVGDTTWGTNHNGTPCDSFYNIIRDPLFKASPPDSAYYLLDTSPCIDAGDSLSPDDPDGTIADMGAFYYDQRTEVTGEDEAIGITGFELFQNYPNPFNSVTQIRYELPKASEVKLTIYNILGQRVAVLANGREATGIRIRTWDGKDDTGRGVASGIYFYRIQVEDLGQSRKMLLLK